MKILEKLKKDEYQIVVNNDINISFNNYGPPFFRIRGLSSSKLREGDFTLIEENDSTLVRLNFRIPFLSLLIAFVILLFLGFLWGWGMLFLIGLFMVGFIFEVVQQKNNAEDLINSIAED